MSKKTVIHLRDQYLRVTFISYMLCGFKKFQHYILCREIYKNDKNLYPFENIIKTHGVFSVFWMIDKILVSGIKLHSRVINDWISYYFSIKKLSNVVVIHAHMGQQGYYAIPLSRKLNIPLVVTFYGADM